MKFVRLHLTAITLFCLILVFTIASRAQESISFEKLNPDDLKMKHCPFDTAAAAMVLSDIGSTVFHYDQANGFYMLYERQLRIMIFKKDGYSYANWSIPLFRGTRSKETLSGFKARTYNLEGDRVVEMKLKDESVFKEEEDSYQQNIRFTFPAVKEGSVIELKYAIKSPFFNHLRDWNFQYSIPARWSEYTVMIPEFYQYATQFFGKVPFYINKISSQQSSVTDRESSARPVFYTDNILHLAARDVPAIKTEPFVNSMDNYSSRAEFVLRSFKFPDRDLVSVNTTWRQVAKDLLKDEDFGLPLKETEVVADLAASVSAQQKTPFDQMVSAFYRVQNLIKWNEHYSKYTSKKTKKTLDEKTGNSADINLLMVMLMRRLGLTADPVLVSTRDHGTVTEANTSMGRMNHVICLVAIDQKEYLLDATHRFLPYTFLPFQCLNGKGMVVAPDTVRWVNLLTDEKIQRYYLANFKIYPEGEISGTLQLFMTGYAGRDIRKALSGSGREEYIKKLKNDLKPWEIEDVSFDGLDTLEQPAKINYRLHSSDITQVAENMIYLNPLANFGQSTFEFSQEKRSLPIDFGCPLKETYSFTYEIPDGFAVESYPDNMRLVLPDQAGSFKFLLTLEGNKIIINAHLAINRATFPPVDYLNLHTFMTQAIAKQAQQIVLKKK